MKIFNKLTALSLVLAILCCGLISCKPKNEGEQYTATIKTGFSSSDEKMDEAIAAFERSEVNILVDGDNMQASSSTKIGSVDMNRTYTVYDGVLYNNTRLVAEGKTVTEQQKAAFDEAKRAELLAKIGAGATLEISDFNDVTEMQSDKTKTYTCSSIKDDAKASLLSIFVAKFDLVGASVSLTDADYYLKTEDGKKSSYILNAAFEITIDGESYSVNMTIECDYSYNGKVKVELPQGADSYKEVSYKDIIG